MCMRFVFFIIAKKFTTMKKLLTIVLSVAGMCVMAQNEGTAVYDMKIEGLPEEQASMMGDMTMKVMWKGEKSYFEQSSMMYEMKSVTDEKGTLVLMDQMGNKYYMKFDANDPKYQANDKDKIDYKIEYTNETKKIAGYDCKKAIVKSKTRDGKDLIIDVWYTDKIPNFYEKQKYSSKRNQGVEFMKQLKGMPLEYSIPQGQMTVRVTAKEINFNPVPDDVFNLSTEGYQQMDPEKMKKGGQ